MCHTVGNNTKDKMLKFHSFTFTNIQIIKKLRLLGHPPVCQNSVRVLLNSFKKSLYQCTHLFAAKNIQTTIAIHNNEYTELYEMLKDLVLKVHFIVPSP